MPRDETVETVIRNNLAAADEKQSALFEIRLGYLRELARALADGGLSPQRLRDGATVREKLDGALAPTGRRQAQILGENADMLRHLYHQTDVLARAQLCRELCAALQKQDGILLEPDSFFDTEESPEPEATGRICYVQNGYTDAVYAAATTFVRNPVPVYAPSYELSCDEVNSGRCEFCILPVENTESGRLFGFYALMDKYDLKIPLTFNVTGSDGSTVTKFALCRRSLSPAIAPPNAPSAQTFLEIRLLPGNPLSPGDIITAADALGLALRRVDSFPLSYTDSAFAFNLIFCADGADLAAFLTLLSVWAPYYIPVGYYREYSGYTIAD